MYHYSCWRQNAHAFSRGYITEEDVEKFQAQIEGQVKSQNGWEVSFPTPHDAVDEGELAVINLYKNGGNDGEVEVFVDINNSDFYAYEYLNNDDIVQIETLNSLIKYCNNITDWK